MALVSKFHTFSDGYIPAALITAARLNTNWDTLYTLVNGLIDQDNIAADYWFIRVLSTLPAWSASYEGKLVYAEDTQTISLANNTQWTALLVSAHASNHMSAGSDPIRIDELKIGTNVTTLNATATEHGLCPRLSNTATEYLNGAGSWVNPKIDDLTQGDNNTDLDSSTSRHGLLPRLSNIASQFINGVGSWATPTSAICQIISDASPRVVISNATSRNKTSYNPVKIKEIRINEAVTGSLLVQWTCITGFEGREITTKVYVNEISAGGSEVTSSTISEGTDGSMTINGPHDGAFEDGDLIEIYGNYTDQQASAIVSDMSLSYTWQITSIDAYTLATPLEVTATTAISTTNQDPA